MFRVSIERPSPEPERLLSDMRWMRSLARSLVTNAADADDIAQDAWLAASSWRDADRSPPRKWLATIVRNLSIRRARTSANREHRERDVARDEALASPEELAARMETQRRLAEAVLRLSEPYRSTVILRYTDELDPSEIARRQHIPAATVRSRLKRALEMLRQDLDRDHRGDRSAWLMALAPFVTRAREAEPGCTPQRPRLASVHPSAGWIAASALMVAGVGWMFVRSRVSVPSLADARQQGTEEVVRQSSAVPLDADRGDRDRRASVNAPSSDDVAHDASPGWWLVGRVRGADTSADELTRVIVRVSEPTQGLDWPASKRPETRGECSRSGELELDLRPLFDDDSWLPQELDVRLERSDRVPLSVKLPVSREQRQRGFMPDGRVELRVDVELRAPFALVGGAVHVPDGIDISRVRTALLPLDAAGKPLEASDECPCDAHGAYRLRAPTDGEYSVVAYVPQDAARLDLAMARPATRLVRVGTGAHVDDSELTLLTGETIDGRISVIGAQPRMAMIVMAETTGKLDDPIRLERDSLRWVNDRFENFRVSAIAGKDGHFRMSGLAAGKYQLLHGGPWWPDFAHRSTSFNCTTPTRIVQAPSRHVELQDDRNLALWQVVGTSGPLAYARLRTDSGQGWNGFECDDRGCVALFYPRDAEHWRATFFRNGFASRSIDLDTVTQPTEAWTQVRLDSDAPSSDLVVELTGDRERFVEQILVTLHPLSGQVSSMPFLLEEIGEQHLLKRTASGIALSRLLPGRWRIEFLPCDQDKRPLLDRRLITDRREVELEPGRSKTIRLALDEGGRLRVVAPNSWGGEWSSVGSVAFRMTDPDGKPMAVRVVDGMTSGRWNDGGLDVSWDQFPGEIESEVFDTLPAGVYTLELWRGDKRTGEPDRTVHVTIEPGKTVDLDVNRGG
jgi:RNA polymerase sigma-70 factor (ECF subfamily)